MNNDDRRPSLVNDVLLLSCICFVIFVIICVIQAGNQ